MAKSKPKKTSASRSLGKLVEFFDTHDMGDYWDHMPEAHFDINIKKRRQLVEIDEELISKLTEIAKAKRVSSKALIDSWLREKILKAG